MKRITTLLLLVLAACTKTAPVELAEKEAADFRLFSESVTGGTILVPGRWYIFGPSEVAKQSGTMGVTFPSWVAGQ